MAEEQHPDNQPLLTSRDLSPVQLSAQSPRTSGLAKIYAVLLEDTGYAHAG